MVGSRSIMNDNRNHVLHQTIVWHILSGDLWGGKEAQMEVQVAALRAQDVDARIILFNEGTTADNYRRAHLPVTVIRETKGIPHLWKSLSQLLRSNRRSLLATHGHKETVLGALLSLRLKIPFVATFHGLPTFHDDFRGLARLRAKLTVRPYLTLSRRFASRLVFVSRALQEDIGFLNDRRACVVWNAVDSNSFIAKPVQTKSDAVPPRPFRYVFVGRLAPVKRVDRIIRAYSAYRKSAPQDSSELWILGTGPEEKQLRGLTRNLPGAEGIKFFGFREDVGELMAQCDVLVLASASEGVPTVLLQAFSLGLKVMTTSVGGIPEVIREFADYPVILLRQGSQSEIIAAFSQVRELKSPDLIRTADVLEKNFSPRAAAEKLRSLYCEALYEQK